MKDEKDIPCINVDAHPDNADWTKKIWDLPPYKSKEFFMIVPEKDLPRFRKLAVYRFAVSKGVIVNDEWVG